jgi:hypothetical protein
MAELQHFEFFDIRGRQIKVGDHVKYINTGTVGKVLEIMEDDEGIWAYLESTELYYKIEFLESAEETPIAAIRRKDLETEIEKKIRLQEETVDSLQNVESRGAPGGAG